MIEDFCLDYGGGRGRVALSPWAERDEGSPVSNARVRVEWVGLDMAGPTLFSPDSNGAGTMASDLSSLWGIWEAVLRVLLLAPSKLNRIGADALLSTRETNESPEAPPTKDTSWP